MIRRAFPYVIGTAVVAAIVTGLILIGSPTEERKRRLDEVRARDLAQLANVVDQYWKREGKLPASLMALATLPGAAFRSAADPLTSQAYSYRVVEASRYELCATFETADAGEYGDRFWAHGEGYKCFELDAQKQRVY
jgi:hypothetical protein